MPSPPPAPDTYNHPHAGGGSETWLEENVTATEKKEVDAKRTFLEHKLYQKDTVIDIS